MAQTPEELYRKREKRFPDAIRLKMINRVPVVTGISSEAACCNGGGRLAEYRRALRDFQQYIPGKELSYLELKTFGWPGHGFSRYNSRRSLDSGFVLFPRGSPDEVNPENFRMMIDFTKEYGVYN
jgi:hypothetical protein